MKKSIISILILSLLLVGQFSLIIKVDGNDNGTKYFPKLPASRISPFRQRIGSNDEGSHYKDNCTHQEWWYFIAFFNQEDSELKNWSMMVSFNQMGIMDMLFCTIYEEKDNHYGGVRNEWKGAMNATSQNVNVTFGNSTVTGKYPEWKVNAEHKGKDGTNVTVNVTYTAKMLPMWLFANTGLNRSNSKIGHYSVINNDVNGTVKINDTTYHVHGEGYHEHSWINDKKRTPSKASFIPKLFNKMQKGNVPDWQLSLNIWDFGAMFFDNGWNIFAAKICQQSAFSKILPGSLWITNDGGKHVTECSRFQLKYLEMQNTSIPQLKIPSKIQIRGFFFKTFLRHPLKGLARVNLILEVENLKEFRWGNKSISLSFVFEAACKVTGNVRWLGNNVKLNGKAMLELTRYEVIEEE